jgi:hypothetical protein
MTKIVEHNAETGEIIQREMSAAEIAQWKLDIETAKIEAEAKATKAAEKVALLAQLGITADQAKLLLS